MATRETRREANQELFRLGNERLRTAVNERVSDDLRVPFLCECADEFCNGRVELRIADWESVARQAGHYVLVSGHLRSDREEIVGILAGYEIVRKSA
jgi:hypothetical protein